MKHASECFVRLVRVLLGRSAVADNKVDFGYELTILGVSIAMHEKGFTYKPSPDKVKKWIEMIKDAIARECLMPGQAMKLAGKLSWGATKLFKQYGRAMLRPIFDQQSKHSGTMDMELKRALLWWIGVLSREIVETRLWQQPMNEVLHLFCDARGQPPHLGAVLVSSTACSWTHLRPNDSAIDLFRSRKDNQIMGLELLSIALGIHTFAYEIKERRIIIHSDNRGSELAIRRGSAKKWDHAQLVHQIWEDLLVLQTQVFVVRVSTHDNIADPPSRESFEIFVRAGATFRTPQLPDVYGYASTWETLHERWALHGR
jgi:hypothetical protein